MRFPGFEGEWEVKKLGEICEIVGGGTPETGIKEYWNGNIQWFTPTEIKSNFVSKSERTITELGLKKSSAKILPKGTILLTTRATIGDVAIALNECSTNQGFQSLILKENYDNVFLFNWTKQNKHELTKRANGSTFPEISKSEIEKIDVTIPNIQEQKKIAEFLSALDSKIQTQKKTIENLKSLKSGLSKKIFSQEIRFKEFNDKWKMEKLDKIATFYSGGTPLTSKKEFFDGDIPFIRSGEINSDTTEQFISELGLKNSSAKMVEVGDILYALYGATSGEVGISKIKGAINQAVLCIKSIENHYFIYSYLLHKKESIIKTYLQGGQGNLSAEIVKQIEIPIPSLPEQQKIANFLSSIDAKIDVENQILQQLEMQKKYFLANLFV